MVEIFALIIDGICFEAKDLQPIPDTLPFFIMVNYIAICKNNHRDDDD